MSRPTAIDPELRGAARVLPRGLPGRDPLRFIRPLERLAKRAKTPADVEIHIVGGVEVRRYQPPASSVRPADAESGRLPALLWIHGGGYVIGFAAQDDRLCRDYARRSGAVVVSVEYRLAPEAPGPAAVEDCHTALAWLATCDDVDPDRIAIGGASAGGGLAAALAHLAVERGEVEPCLQLLAYPMLDDRTVLRRDLDESGFRLWNNRSNRFGWRSHLGVEPGGDDDLDPWMVPARAESLADLPPAWIGVGTLDLFHDEDVAYAERLEADGVACTLDTYPGGYHAFDVVVPNSAIGRRFRNAQIAALDAAFA
jgi:acetyl esterase/lipase